MLHLDVMTVTGKTLGENLEELKADGFYDKCDGYLKKWDGIIQKRKLVNWILLGRRTPLFGRFLFCHVPVNHQGT